MNLYKIAGLFCGFLKLTCSSCLKKHIYALVIGVYLASGAALSARGSDIKIATNVLGRMLNVSTSVRALSKQGANALRDQAWLSFMNQLYTRQPNIPQADLVAAYIAYTNLFAASSTAINFQNPYANPSSAEIYDLISQSASGFTNLAPYAPFALSAAHFAAVTQSLSNGLQSILVNTLQSPASTLQGLTLSGLAQLDNVSLAPNSLHSLVDSSISIALQNPEFNQAYTAIITPMTGILATDGVNAILQKVPALNNDPTVSAIVSAIQSDGYLQLDTNTLLNLFSNQVGNLGLAVNNVLGQVGSSISGEVNLVSTTFDPQLFSQIDDIQSALSPLSDNDLIGSSVGAFDLLGSIAGTIDPNLGNQIATVGSAVTTVASTVGTVMDIADAAGSILGAFDGIGAVMDVASLFGGGLGSLFGGGNSQEIQMDQQILSAIGQLQNQIQNLQQNMDQRFNQVDSEINQVYTQMNNGFQTLENDFAALQGTLNQDYTQIRAADVSILVALIDQQDEFSKLDGQIYAALAADALQDLVVSINESLGFQSMHGTPLPLITFQNCESEFLTYATYDATDDQFSPNQPEYFQSSIYNELTSNTLDYQLNYIDWVIQNQFSLPPINSIEGVPLANPTIWATAAKALIQLGYENPSYFSTYQSDVSRVLNEGLQLETSINNLTCTNLGTGGVNWALWNSLFNAYSNSIPVLQVAISNSEAQYAASLGLSYIDFFNESDYLENVAGIPLSPVAFGENPIHDATGTNAVVNELRLCFANSTDGISGLDIYSNIYYIRNVSFGGTVTTVVAFTNGYYYGAIGPSDIFATANYGGTQIFSQEFPGFFVPIAGGTAAGFKDGPGGAALFGAIYGLLYNEAGHLFVLDIGNNALRTVATNASVSTFATNLPVLSTYYPLLVGTDNQGGVYLQYGLTNYTQVLVRITTNSATTLLTIPPGLVNYGTITSPLIITNFSTLDVNCQPSGSVLVALDQFATNGGIAQYPATGESISLLEPNGSLGTQYFIPYLPQFSPFTGYAGLIGSSATLPGFTGMTVDSAGNIWLPVAGGVLRIGGSPYHTIGFLTNLASTLQQAGPLYTAANNTSGYKSLIQDILQFGLSQSYASDDIIRSAFNSGGYNNLLDMNSLMQFATASPLLTNSVLNPPLPNIFAEAYSAASQLQRQTYLHLQDIAARAQTLGGRLVADVIISNNAALDVSSYSNPIGEVGFPFFGTTFGGNNALGYLYGNNSLPFTQLQNGLSLGHPTNLVFSATNDFSISFWATFPDSKGGVVVGDLESPGWSVMLSSNGLTGWWTSTGGSTTNFTFGSLSNIVFLNHCVVVFSATTGVIRGYINGALMGQEIFSTDTSSLGNNEVMIGGFSDTQDPTRTSIGEVTVWNRALAAVEVASIFNASTPRFEPLTTVGKQTTGQTFPTEPLSLVHSTINDLKLLQGEMSLPSPTPSLSAALSTSNMSLTVYGRPGSYYTLQSSSDFRNWEPYSSSVLEGAATNIPPQAPAKFFRAVEQ
jgi:hypothetical protein